MTIGILGNYNIPPIASDLIRPGSKCHEVLFEDLEIANTSAREKILQIFEQIIAKTPPIVSHDPSNLPQITVEELIGTENVDLFIEALKEEAKSKEFIEAVFHASTTRFGGEKKAKNMDLIIAGPSSSGKTSASIEIASQKIGAGLDPDGKNYMVACDGGIVREVSQIRRAISQTAHILGYGYISDLSPETIMDNILNDKFQKHLDPVKKRIKKAAKFADCGLIIPETFSQWPAGKKIINDILEKNTNAEFVLIRQARDNQAKNYSNMRSTVFVSGNDRAKLKRKYDRTEIDLNISADEIAESKAYNKDAFNAGVKGSHKASKYFEKMHNAYKHQKKRAITVSYPLILIKKDPKLGWIPAENEFDGVVRKTSRKCFEAWMKQTESNLLLDYDSFEKQYRLQQKNKHLKKPEIYDEEHPVTFSERITAQTQYMQLLYDKAVASATQTPALFDEQGKLLLEVELVDEDYKNLNQEMGIESSEKAVFDHLIGFDTAETISIRLDLDTLDSRINNNYFAQCFYGQLENTINSIQAELTKDKIGYQDYFGNTDDICYQYKMLPKGSIIPLTREFYFHLKGIARIYEEILEHVDSPRIILDSKLLKMAHQEAMLEVNELALQYLAKALLDSYESKKNNCNISIEDINTSLNKARKELAPIAHKILIKKIAKKHSIDLATSDILDKIQKHAKHTACSLTATGDDLLHINQDQISLIQNTQLTAHNREKGADTASRQIITHFLNEGHEVCENNNSRIQVRVPSLAIKEHSRKDVRVDDVELKLSNISQQYFTNQLSDETDKPKAFIYNLYTSLNDRIDQANDLLKFITSFRKWLKGEETGRNLQTQSADDILRGAHQYNAQQLQLKDPVFCFVQNISINYSGQPLRNRFNRPGIATTMRQSIPVLKGIFNFVPFLQPTMEEASLMADIALLHTICDESEHAEKILAVISQYNLYLQARNHDAIVPADLLYFCETSFGNRAKTLIKEIKTTLKNSYFEDLNSDFSVQTKLVLQRLFANDLHQDHQYAKLVQSLSVFSEQASIGGCKSANERAQAINLRVMIFDLIANESKYLAIDEINEIKTIFEDLNTCSNDKFKEKVIKLNLCLDNLYDDYALHLAASEISLDDQLAAPKFQPQTALNARIDKWLSTKLSSNYGEESTLKNLKQSKASSMQAHKNVAKLMQNALSEIISEKSSSDSLTMESEFSGSSESITSLLAQNNKNSKETTKKSLFQKNKSNSPSTSSSSALRNLSHFRPESDAAKPATLSPKVKI